ncbi:hypothetical protein HYPSUDRAFT_247131 [Hypholoma sublateritium FD-334 SS-4]|uniref:Uncharacterized protein n=1 Tax=Hypholoma sublateritium (strain FD-334 SS-4) TaxID=945553 RepID=A0A0D2LPA2_HYPSF|nr:hypothetical protein HYPSUDRAFT_247131 [Hypholoma sublateritium FD-334 SS-4]
MADYVESSIPKGGAVKDTLRSVRTDGSSHSITNSRCQISEEMDGEFLVYDSGVFMAKYLPFVPTDADIAKCTRGMLESHLMLRQDGLLRFKDFVNISDRIDASEKVAYEHLVAIADSIGRYELIPEGRSRNRYHYRKFPGATIRSNIAGSNTKIDACITSSAEGLPPTTSSIAVPAEYNLHTADRYDNNRKVVSANVQIMNADPRRMFTFRYTYEIPNSDGEGSRFYHTIKPISEYRSNNITGRMTRVWLTCEVASVTHSTPIGPECILKDV